MNSAVLNSPTPATSSAPTAPIAPAAPPQSRGWRIAALSLAVVVALLAAAVSFESYALFRGSGQATVARPSAGPAAQAPSAPAPAAAASVLPDWPLPLPALGTGPSWDRLSLLQQQMDQVFNNTLSQFAAGAPGLGSFSSPNFDLREEKDHYTVRADMPGADKATINVTVEGRMLTISGQRSALSETQTGDAVLRSERNMAQFVRTVQLPGPVKAAEVDAKYENGVLTLKLPKADQATASTQVPVH